MKRMLYLINAVLIFNLFACAQQVEEVKKETAKKDWETFSDSNCEIQYPSDWEESTSGEYGTTFILYSPNEGPSDKFRENINFMIQDLQGQIKDLDAYVELSESQVETIVKNGEMITSKRENNKNGEHHKMIYYGTQGDMNLRFEQYFWVKDDKAYLLTFTSEKDAFKRIEKVSKKIVASFRLK